MKQKAFTSPNLGGGFVAVILGKYPEILAEASGDTRRQAIRNARKKLTHSQQASK